MSHKPRHHNHQHHHYRDKSPQERLVTRVDQGPKPHYPDQSYRLSYQEEPGELGNGTPHHSRIGLTLEEVKTLPTSESYDIIRYDDGPAPVTEPEYFHELYGQENNADIPRLETERHPVVVQRSRSLPPGTDVKTRLGANFPYANAPLDNPAERSQEENDILGEFIRQESLPERRSSLHRYSLEEMQTRGRSPPRKVSYGQRPRNEKLSSVSVKKQNSPLQCRFRADIVETDESDISFTVSNPTGRKGRSQSVGSNKNGHPALPNQTFSDRSFTIDAQSLEDFVNRNNNCRVSNRYSQDSIPGVGEASSNVYGKDVLPLPIEIPDNVADAEAFRRYLSNQSCPSYESIGRRPRKAALGLTSSGRLGHEASRRTSSLSHAIMTLALLSASICQLRFLVTYSHAHSYPILNYFLIFTSIILEVAAGIGYVLVARCSYDDSQSETIHNYLIFALFIVAVSNVILAAFAFDNHLCDEQNRIISRMSVPSTASQDQYNQPASRADRVMDLRYMPLE